jgi:aminobenzoyl-glutamate utilization protein B
MMRPELVTAARTYLDTVQGRQRKYQPLIRPEDKPPIWLNEELMERYRPALRKFYYDASKYKSYLEQLRVPYPPQ